MTMGKMPRIPTDRWFTFVVLATALVIPACNLHSDNAVSDPAKAAVDEKLLGTWQSEPQRDPAEPNAPPTACVATIEKLSRPGYPSGAMQLTLTLKGGEDKKSARVIFFSTELQGKRFASVCIGEDEGASWEKVRADGYTIYRYDVSDKELTLYVALDEAFEKAFAAGKIKGEFVKGPAHVRYLHVTDTSAKLAEFLSSVDGNAAFAKGAFEFKRVK